MFIYCVLCIIFFKNVVFAIFSMLFHCIPQRTICLKDKVGKWCVFHHVQGALGSVFERECVLKDKTQKCACPCENSKKFCHLQKNFQELLREINLNLFSLLVLLAHLLVSKSLKIATTRLIKWLKLYVILCEVNVFVLAYFWLSACYL